MLQSGVDPLTISQLLGHASVNTTNRYAAVNLEMKRKAIEKATAIQQKKRSSSWKKNPSILEWLESL
jgi:integrase